MTEDRRKIVPTSRRASNNLLRRVRIAKQHLLIVCLCLIACSSCIQPAYEHYQVIEHDVWEKDREYSFTFEVDDAAVPYDLTLEIRNNNRYPFQNLWILGSSIYPDSVLRRDTMEYMLANEFGEWYGKGISVFQLSIPLRSHFFFPERGQYTFGFRQGMRKDELPGIQGIGLRVEKSN